MAETAHRMFMKQIENVRASRVCAELGGGTTRPLGVECETGEYFVAKLPTRKERCQLIVNELVAGILLQQLGLPAPTIAIVDLPETCECKDPSIAERLYEARRVCSPLKCVGTRFWEGYSEVGGNTIAPDMLVNPDVVPGAVVFDTWVYNQDTRHFLGSLQNGRWHLGLFDNDGAFNRDDWILHDGVRADMNCTRLGDWVRSHLREGNLVAFERQLQTLEDDNLWSGLRQVRSQVPPAWVGQVTVPRTSVEELLEKLYKRRHHVRQLLQSRPA